MPLLGKFGRNRLKIEFCRRLFTLRGSNTLFSRKNQKSSPPNIDDREFRELPHCALCIFDKKFVKITFLLKSWIHEIFRENALPCSAIYSHGQELLYKFVSNFANKLVKQLLSMTVCWFHVIFTNGLIVLLKNEEE